MKQKNKLLPLLLDFVRFGCFTFGGGWSIIAQMQQLYVQERKTITSEELLDLTSVAKSLPGTMISNVSMLYGYRVAGYPGGLTATFGMTLPPMAILIVISFFYQAFRSNYWVNAVMQGMQAAVVPIIIAAAVGLVKGSFKLPPCVVICALALAAYLFADVSPIILVLAGAAAGLAIGEFYERRAQKHGSA